MQFNWLGKIGYVLLLSSVLCTQVACIAVTERSVSPIELPDNFSVQGGDVLQPDWWLQFDDPGLTAAINQSLSGNFTLLAARDRLAQARAIAKKEGADLFPQLDGGGSLKEAWSYEDSESSSTSDFDLDLSASYEIDLWGRLRFKRDAALLDVEVSSSDLQTAAISLASQVAKTWYQIAESKKQINLAEEQRGLNESILELITTQFKAGQVGIADVMQQKQLVETSTGDIISLTASQRILDQQLAVLTGNPPTNLNLATPEEIVTPPSLPDIGVPLDLLLNRPDIQSSFYELLAADQRVAEAVANRFPRLSITADLSTGGEDVGDLFSNWFANIGANLVGPIVDGGYRKAEVERVEAVASQKFNLYGQTVLDGLSEVEEALIRENEQRDLLENLQIRLDLAERSIARIGDRYRQGAVDYQRVLTAIISFQGLQQKILSAKRQIVEYRIQLYGALGGRIDLPE